MRTGRIHFKCAGQHVRLALLGMNQKDRCVKYCRCFQQRTVICKVVDLTACMPKLHNATAAATGT